MENINDQAFYGCTGIKTFRGKLASNDNNIDNPYAEGLVINAAGGKHYRVDAHYESRVMTFRKSSITALKGALGKGTGYILNMIREYTQEKV